MAVRGNERYVRLGALPSLTGDGKCSRVAARRSPGASKATTGAPKVTPISEARDPPSEWPDDWSACQDN